MARAVHGEYGAFTTKNSVRYQKDNKLVSEKAIPPEVVSLLNKQLGYIPKETSGDTTTFPQPTEEQKKQLREESLQVPEHLQRQDFDDEPIPEDATGTPLPRADEPVRLAESPTQRDNRELADVIDSIQPNKPTVDSDFLESVSIHSASLEDIAKALYNRFGLYTVYLGQLPVADEINPLTAEPFSNYHLGIAYQAAIRAQHSGVLDRPPEVNRKVIDEGRDASANFQEAFVPVPKTMAEARRADSFDFRTSPQGTRTIPTTEVVHETDEHGVVHAVQQDIPEGETGRFNGAHARYDSEEDEPLVEPNFGGKPVIRPDW